MRRRLLIVTAAALFGYGIGWNAHAFGWTPVLLLSLVAALSWLAGASWVALPLTLAVADANRAQDEAERERDEIAARLAQLEDGGRYVASVLSHPSVRVRLLRSAPGGKR